MDYCNNPDIVFVAIPKTGTRSVVDYMKKHFGARRFKGTRTHEEVIPEALRNHFSFAVVRNPFDRVISYWWSTCQRPGGSGMDLMSFITRPPLPHVREFQHPYLEQNKIDRIIRFEQLEDQFKELPFYIEGTSFEWLNPTVNKAAHNPTTRPSTKKLLTPKLCDLIRTKFQRDFEVCGYSTEYEANK